MGKFRIPSVKYRLNQKPQAKKKEEKKPVKKEK